MVGSWFSGSTTAVLVVRAPMSPIALCYMYVSFVVCYFDESSPSSLPCNSTTDAAHVLVYRCLILDLVRCRVLMVSATLFLVLALLQFGI